MGQRKHLCFAGLEIAALLAFTFAATSRAEQTGGDKAIGVKQALASLPPDLKTPNRYALVIGASKYADHRIPHLPACANDARGIVKVLVDDTAGLFPKQNVTLLVNEQATRNRIVKALDDLARQADAEDLVIVFFSGHGATDEHGQAYWVMADTEIDALRATAIPETDVTKLLGEIKTKRLVTFIDACYSASTAELKQTKSLLDLKQLFPQFRGEGRVAITASKGDRLSLVINDRNDPGHGYSAFSWHLIEGMKGAADNDDGVVTVTELWNYVKDRTEQTARREGGDQQPQLKGQIGSRFLLTVNRDQLLATERERPSRSRQTRARVRSLLNLLSARKITGVRFDEGRKLLETPEDVMSDLDRKKLKIYADLADRRFDPEHLEPALLHVRPTTPTHVPPPSPSRGEQAVGDRFTNSVGMKFVRIKPGEFLMGSPAGEEQRDSDETQHRVRLTKSFFMGVTEVTQAQWKAVMGSNRSWFKGDNLPVENVSWNTAVEFGRKLSQKEGSTYRLPTEAQWEYACRAGTTTPFNTGRTISTDEANYNGDQVYGNGRKGISRWKTTPAGSFRPNRWGLYDMHGNVYEWCSDLYANDYPAGFATDPAGPCSGKSRVVRGGSWFTNPRTCRSADRYWPDPVYRPHNIGFRVVCSVRPGLAE